MRALTHDHERFEELLLGPIVAPHQARYAVPMPSRDAQWIIGTILAAAVALSVQMAGLRGDHAEAPHGRSSAG